MDVSSGSGSSANHSDDVEDISDLRRGPWTVEEDLTLINYITNHGEGRWNSLARCAGLKRTGKSCRLRWLNYLRPDVRRGNITLEEQLLILELHSRWGNRWSKIAQHLPGRTDNEIKNYWRTRVQKHAKQLQCDVNSKQFKDTMRYLWMPRLVERIQAASAASSSTTTANTTGSVTTATSNNNYYYNNNQDLTKSSSNLILPAGRGGHINSSVTAETSSTTGASSDSMVSDFKDYYVYDNQSSHNGDFQNTYVNYPADTNTNIYSGYYNQQGLAFQEIEQQRQRQQEQQQQQNMWFTAEDTAENTWNAEDLWFLQQQFCNGNL